MEVTSTTTPKNGPLPSFTQKRKQLDVTVAESKCICFLKKKQNTLSPHSRKPTTYNQSQKIKADFSEAILGCD